MSTPFPLHPGSQLIGYFTTSSTGEGDKAPTGLKSQASADLRALQAPSPPLEPMCPSHRTMGKKETEKPLVRQTLGVSSKL